MAGKRFQKIVLWSAVFLLCASVRLPALESDTAVLTLKDGAFTLDTKTLPHEKLSGGFYVYDGENGKTYTGRDALENSGFTWTVKPSVSEKLFRMDCVIHNKSRKELRLEPGLNLHVPRRSGDFFWGGFDVVEAGDKPVARLGLKGRTTKHIGGGLNQPFPVSAVISNTRSVFLGQFQFDYVSWNGARYEVAGSGSAKISFSQRIVVAPGGSVDFRFLIGVTPVRFGCEENVVQAFYDAYPETWRPVQDQDNPYIWYAHSQYRAWYFKPDREKERRFYAAVDWAYTPYKRSGDAYGHQELWDYKPAFGFSTRNFASTINGTLFEYAKLSQPEFQRKRAAVFRKNGRDFGYAFYANPAWCEIQLANEKYPDAINRDTEGGVPMILGPWSTAHDREIRVLPMGTSFAKAFQSDLKRLYQELKFPGFAMDCGTPGVFYRGPAAKDPEQPGRAWDEKGVFIDESVAVKSMIDFLHSLNPADPPFVWKNGQGSGDYMMIETSIFNPVFRSWMPLNRYNIGMRPAVMHGPGFLVDSTIPDWRNLSQDAFYEKLAKLGDHAVLTDFQYGFTQSHVTQSGNPQSIYCMPELLECIRTGWQALIPVAVNDGGKFLYRARYGRAADTILYFGNPWQNPMKLNFEVDNSALGKGWNLFVGKMRDKARLENHIEGTDTRFTASLPSRRPALFEAVCNLSGLPASGILNAAVSSEKEIDRIVFTVKLDNSAPFRTAVTPREIYNFIPQIFVNGSRVNGSESVLPAGAEIRIVYASKVFHCNAGTITSFPFTDDGKMPSFEIQIPADPNPAELKESGNLQSYFRFTAGKKITRSGRIWVRKGDAEPSVPTVRISVGRGGKSGIARKGDLLILSAGNERQAAAMMKELNYVMDRRFEYLIPFAPHDSITAEMIRKFDMKSRLLPFERCFESAGGVE